MIQTRRQQAEARPIVHATVSQEGVDGEKQILYANATSDVYVLSTSGGLTLWSMHYNSL